MKLTNRELLTAAIESLKKWQANRYRDDAWTLGASSNTCEVCIIAGFYDRGREWCKFCPLAAVDCCCLDDNSPYEVAGRGNKRRLVAALRGAVAYAAAAVLMDELAASLEEALRKVG